MSSACMFCRATDQPSSEEHILPESLTGDVSFTATGTGPTVEGRLVLPRGFVCRKCNNTVLSQLDEHLQEALGFFKPFWNAKGTKKGRPAKTVRPGVVVSRTPTGPKIIINNEKHSIVTEDGQVVAPFRGGPTDPRLSRWKVEGNEVSFNLQSPFVVDRKLLRAFYKIGIELVALQKGLRYVLSADFDPIRTFVRHGRGQRYVAIVDGPQPKQLMERPHLGIEYLPSLNAWVGELQLGAVIYLDLSRGGILTPPERRDAFRENGLMLFPRPSDLKS